MQKQTKHKRKEREMKHTKLLTSTCVLLAGLCSSSAFSAPSVRTGTVGTTTGGTIARAGTLRVQPTARNVSVAQKSTSASADAARLASLPGIGSNKLSVNPKLPSSNTSAVADLRSAIEELSLTTTSTANALYSVQSGLEKLQDSAIDSEAFEAGIREAKDYTDTTAGTLETEKIQPLARSIEDVSVTISNVASKDYVDEQVAEVALTAFNEEQVNRAIANKLATENYKGYTDDKMSAVVTNRIVPLEAAVDNIDVDMDMRVANDEIQYKSTKATEWKKLADKSDFGGTDGITPILMKDDVRRAITVRYGNEAPVDLVAYDAITGPAGPQGVAGSNANVTTDVIKGLGFYTKAETQDGFVEKNKFGTALKDPTIKQDVKAAVLASDVLNGIEFQTTEEEVQYSTNGGVTWKQLAAKSEFAGLQGEQGPIGPQGPQGEPGVAGQDSCKEVSSVYTGPSGSSNGGFTKIGYLTITVHDQCEEIESSYRQEDNCFLANFMYADEVPYDRYSCEKQNGGGTYTLIKSNAPVSQDVKTLLSKVVITEENAPNSFKTKFKNAIAAEVDDTSGSLNTKYVQQVKFKEMFDSNLTAENISAQGFESASAAENKYLNKSLLGQELKQPALQNDVKVAVQGSGALDSYVNDSNFESKFNSAVETSLSSGDLKTINDNANTAKTIAQTAQSDASSAISKADAAHSIAEAALPRAELTTEAIKNRGFATAYETAQQLVLKANKAEAVMKDELETNLNDTTVIQNIKRNVLGDCSRDKGDECPASLESRITDIERRLSNAGF